MGPSSVLTSRSTSLTRIFAIASLCAALAVTASAQRFGGFRGGGVPASVTSFGFGGQPGFGGVPASVTSPGFGFVPHNFVGVGGRVFIGRPRIFFNPLFKQPGFFPARGGFFGGNGFGRGAFGFGGGIVPWFPAVPSYAYYGEGEAVPPEAMVAQPAQPQPIVVVVPERGEREISEREAAPPPQPRTVEAPPAPATPPPPPTVFVLRNGQKLELSDYALTADTLYDLRDGRTRKISLAEVDLPATVKANEDRGIEFTLPNAARVHIR